MADNGTAVKIPHRMRKRPRYQGMVIPYTTWIHPLTHVPDFKINDEHRRLQCIRHRKCALCGERMNKLIAFIGGQGLIEDGALCIDAGMHPECARYAWEVCPYIVYGKGHAKNRKEHPGAVITVFDAISPERPDKMGLAITDSYEPVYHQGNLFARAGKAHSIIWRTYA